MLVGACSCYAPHAYEVTLLLSMILNARFCIWPNWLKPSGSTISTLSPPRGESFIVELMLNFPRGENSFETILSGHLRKNKIILENVGSLLEPYPHLWS